MPLDLILKAYIEVGIETGQGQSQNQSQGQNRSRSRFGVLSARRRSEVEVVNGPAEACSSALFTATLDHCIESQQVSPAVVAVI